VTAAASGDEGGAMTALRWLVRRSGVAVAVLLAAALVPVEASAGTLRGGATTTPGAAPAAETRTITLMTGDRVRVTGGRPSIAPAPGREHVRFVRHAAPDGLYVVPSDAMALVATGVLDRKLFNVTHLIENGFDDRSRQDLPLLLQHDASRTQTRTTDLGMDVTVEIASVGITAVTEDKARIGAAWQALTGAGPGATAAAGAGVARVWLDDLAHPVLDESVPQIGAPAAWAEGFTGAGTTVAVLDSGYDPDHPDLADAVVEAVNFTDAPDVRDTVGHGTHVASIVTGNGAASGGRYQGVAPDTQLLIGKVCDDLGCPFSSILAGMEWAATRGADVVNMSLGGADGPEIDPLEQAVNTLTAEFGTTFVIAAGNDGEFGDETVGSPSSADAAISVGAVSKQDELAVFSSRGPRVGDGAIKPDITAPGVDIVAARAAGTQLGELVGDDYVAISGTSMAAPHVAGAVAILAGQHPDWTPEQLKATLMASADPHPALGPFAQGAGRVDVARAVRQAVHTFPASVSLGVARWPHDDDEPVTAPVTYRNLGPAAVTLGLTLEIAGPDGSPAPAGMFSIDATQVMVPAGGEAAVTVTANTAVPGADGFYGGMLSARSADGTTTVGTPVAIVREVESYDLTLTFVDRNGRPATSAFTLLTGLDAPTFRVLVPVDGTATARLPRGRYLLDAVIDTEDASLPFGFSSTVVAEPSVLMDRDTDLVLDARSGQPVRVTVPDPSARPVFVDIGHRSEAAWGVSGFDFIFDGFDGAYVVPTRSPQPGAFIAYVNSAFADPGPEGQFLDSAFVYNLSFVTDGGFPRSLTWQVRRRDLATVVNRLAAAAPGKFGDTASWPFLANLGEALGVAVFLPVALPTERVEYFNTGVHWFNEFVQFADPMGFPETLIDSSPVAYRAGRRTTEVWNAAVFGPAFPDVGLPFPWVGRTGDTLLASIPLHSDQAPAHAGVSLVATGETVLYRNGEEIGRSPFPTGDVFELPAEPATYQLAVSAVRQGDADLSTDIRTTWTFRSGHVPGDGLAALPLLTVRFAPHLDLANQAPAGQRFRIPVVVERQFGASGPQPTDLSVETSFDDGQSWQPVRLTRQGDRWVALVQHADAPGFVSLRATASDRDGNRVEETIIRAYRVE
jgi:subtilisin family serine protease